MTRAAIDHFDLSDYTNADAPGRRSFGKAFVAALRRTGFVTVEGHALSEADIAQAYEVCAAYFALPETEKMKAAGALRGYTPFGREHAKDTDAPDLKEFFQIGHETGAREAPNVWPDEPEAFRETILALFDRLMDSARTILHAIEDGLDLPQDYFTSRVEGGTSLLRLLHYPPVPDGADPRCVRAAAHEDINLITLLVAAQGAGLEILDRDGRWLPVMNAPGHLVVDTGDMMARITGGDLPATTHRVVNPAGENVSRYSMPFFVQPRSDVMLEPVPGLDPERAEPPVSAGAFLEERLRAIGLKDG
ncbi:MAG: 2-oxoglutarate and iron-dependent oxygenase domain-containing protein [Oceanicaulis sp.]